MKFSIINQFTGQIVYETSKEMQYNRILSIFLKNKGLDRISKGFFFNNHIFYYCIKEVDNFIFCVVQKEFLFKVQEDKILDLLSYYLKNFEKKITQEIEKGKIPSVLEIGTILKSKIFPCQKKILVISSDENQENKFFDSTFGLEFSKVLTMPFEMKIILPTLINNEEITSFYPTLIKLNRYPKIFNDEERMHLKRYKFIIYIDFFAKIFDENNWYLKSIQKSKKLEKIIIFEIKRDNSSNSTIGSASFHEKYSVFLLQYNQDFFFSHIYLILRKYLNAF